MKVFINKRIPEIGIQLLEEAGLEVIIPKEDDLKQEEWLKYCQNADMILNVG
ncbi:hypothetical protein [Chryseobacterium aquaticum]|uniref:hypothetical protein n=1 Tax=Chryseobacterium aquaticum TaxID=452084 RepID=UPI003F704347